MRHKIFFCLLCFTLSGCQLGTTRPQASLFERIGGKPMLTRLSNQTIDIVSHDPKTSRSFKDIKLATLKQSLADFLCVKTGGDCVYEGETMQKAHADAKITMAEYELLVEVLRQRMNANGVATREKNELLKILAPMKHEIVTQ